MGFFKKILNLFGMAKDQKSILILGLDNSGKTTIINRIKSKKNKKETVPTIGFEKETFSKKNFQFNVIDMSGQQKYRSLWEAHYKTSDAIIFVIDSSEKIRLSIVKYELDNIFNHQDIKEKTTMPILFFANKMDVDSAVKPWEVEEELELIILSQSNGLTGDGLEEGITWLMQKLSK